MAATRTCLGCGRPNGPKLPRCMYCGGALPPPDDQPPTEQDTRERSERARQLLADLKPAARALMPADVLRRLEAEAEGGIAPAPPPSSLPPDPRHISAGPSGPRPVASRGLARRRHPRPDRHAASELAPGPTTDESEDSLPELPFDSVADLVAPLPEDVADIAPAALEPLPDRAPLPFAARSAAAATPEPSELLARALARGGGPLGPRRTPFRLLLLPDAAYRAGLPWLRPRLAQSAGLDPYTAAQTLQRPTPALIASSERRAELEASAEDLRRAGLHVAIVAHDAWTAERLPIEVEDVEDLDAPVLVMRCADGDRLDVPRGQLLGAYMAEIGPIVGPGVSAPERNRWGLPRAVERPGLGDRFTPYYVLDLLRASDPRPLRIRSSTFAFDRLGDDRGVSAAMNVRALARRLGPPPDGLPIDDAFRRVVSLAGTDEPDGGGGAVPRREVDFTEYVLVRALRHHPLG